MNKSSKLTAKRNRRIQQYSGQWIEHISTAGMGKSEVKVHSKKPMEFPKTKCSQPLKWFVDSRFLAGDDKF